jgi:hypothetical protein
MRLRNWLVTKDLALAKLYSYLLKVLPKTQADALRESERKWLSDRDSCEPKNAHPPAGESIAICVYEKYRDRLRELSALASEHTPLANLKAKPKFRQRSKDGKILFFDEDLFNSKSDFRAVLKALAIAPSEDRFLVLGSSGRR